MRLVRVLNETRRTVLGGRVALADSAVKRMRGFLFRSEPVRGEGLFLTPCRGVHMYGMRYPLDVLMLDQGGVVIAAHPQLRPGRRTPVYRNAQYALELPAGTIDATATAVGDRLVWQPAETIAPAEGSTAPLHRAAAVGGGRS